MIKTVLGWTRDSKGIIRDRHPMEVCNCMTSFCGGGITGKDGLANCTPYVLEVWER